MNVGPLHESLKTISFLIGKWKSVNAKGIFPTVPPFTFCEELTFTSVGQPLLNYSSYTWHPENKKPMHLEAGFLLIKPGSNKLAFVVATNMGVIGLEEGRVEDDEIHLKSTEVITMPFAKGPEICELRRHFKYVRESGELELIVGMATGRTPYSDYLQATYTRCDGILSAINSVVNKC